MDRRAFVQALVGGVASSPIRVGHNENPYGPGPAAIEAIAGMCASANRYPDSLAERLVSAIAVRHDVPREYIRLSGGSGDIMRAAVYAFTTRTTALVTARPSYEAPMRSAQHIGSPVLRVPLTPALRLDLAAMGARAPGAGLVYVCNPNNPTSASVSSADLTTMIERVVSESPDTRILVDEAYLDYADSPESTTLIPIVAKYPQVIVTRTFSKIHGMAGMRVAYGIAQPDTLDAIRRRHSYSSLSSMSLAAATASLEDVAHLQHVAAMNRDVRAGMVDAFKAAGYRVAPADANFVFVHIRRDAQDFAKACRVHGVQVGRAFPPMHQWARIAVGTREEMETAMAVFMNVLSVPPRTSVTAPRIATT